MTENEVAALAVVSIFALPTMGFVFMRMLAHRERMEMIRNGMAPTADPRWAKMAAAQQMAQPPRPGWYGDPHAQLRKGVVTTCIGVALLIGLGFIGYSGDGTFRLGPWLLGGLIPMFVGIAQIVNAMLAGASIPTMPRNIGVPPQPPPTGSTPPPNGPYAYRPGATEELPRTKPPQNP